MDDDEYYDDWDDDYDLDWLYVEESHQLADELAEGQIAEPGYAGTTAEMAIDDYDYFAFWNELEGDMDTYWDGNAVVDVGENAALPKRKRDARSLGEPKLQRRNVLSLKDTDGGSVRFYGYTERIATFFQPPKRVVQPGESWALLPDWRKRFALDDGAVEPSKSMPAEMRKAAEGVDRKATEAEQEIDGTGVEVSDEAAREDEWEDEDEERDEYTGNEELASLDPEMLKAVLKQRLGDAGLQDMDESAFMQTIAKMLSGEHGADDAAGDLADRLLGQGNTDGTDPALSNWLSAQGVSLGATVEKEEVEEDEDEDEDGASSSANKTPPSVLSRKSTQYSYPDSAIGMTKNPTTARGDMDIFSTSPTTVSTTSKKRAAPDEEHDDTPASKEPARSTKRKKRAA